MKIQFKKYINNALISIVLLNNLTAFSNAGELSLDNRYETFKGNNIQINNILEGQHVNIEIEGYSLANILSYKTSDNFSWLDGTVDEDGYIEITADGEFKNFFINKEDISVKPSTTYTYFLEIAENTLVRDDGSLSNCIRMGGTHETSRPSYWKDSVWISGGTTGKYKFTLTTKDSFEDVITGDRGYVNWTTSGKLKMRYMIIEGDHTDKDLDYFEGIKSVGQNEEFSNSIGIKSSNKNLFDINNWVNVKYAYTENFNGIDYENKTVTVDGILPDTYIQTGATGNTKVSNHEKPFLIEIQPNTTYTLSFIKDGEFTGSNYFQQYDKNYNNLGVTAIGNDASDINCSETFTTKSNTKYLGIRFGIRSVGNSIVYSNIQLERSDIATNYEPTVYDKKEILLNEPLRSCPDGTRDRIIKKNGQWVVERNLKQITFSDATGWELSLKDSTISRFDYHVNDLKSMGVNFVDLDSFLPDKLLVKSFSDIYHGRCKGVSAYNQIIVISLGGTGTISDLDNYLKNNPLTVVYPLETPIYEPLNIDSTINTYLNVTHISNNSNIPANMKVTIDRTINKAVEAIEIAKINPTTTNISQARMWANLLKESTAKDELQNELNNIVSIKDLEIEKKTVTANLDVYVKSENALSMSLSTNSVTFEGYNGTEDLEKLNAVDVIVSSSLPYDLNAYLEESLQNSDKSSNMSPSTINIKEGSNTDYSQFINNTDKVVLKSDCEASNNRNHSIDLKLASNSAHKADVYKAVIKFEAVQK